MSNNIIYSDLFSRRFRRLFFSFLFVCLHAAATAQTTILDTPVQLSEPFCGEPRALLDSIENRTNTTISYSNKVFAGSSISIDFESGTLQNYLDRIFGRFPVEYIVRGNKIIVAPQRTRRFVISGYCRDARNSEVLIGANVYDTLLYIGAATNDYGFFSITMPEGHMSLRASFVGYKPTTKNIILTADTTINFGLMPMDAMSDVDVSPDEADMNRSKTGFVDLPIEQVQAMPTLFGEADIIGALQRTPGVHSGEEGFGGMSVRGGNSDQNIVLLDDVPIYSPNHLMGLFTVFNSECVNKASLVKSGFPARYGGRMSSVLDVKTREGNIERYAGHFNVGLLALSATFEGPVIKDKMSFILSGRRTYADMFANNFQANNDNKYSFYFYDISAKLNYIISKRDRIYVSFFTGYDNFRYSYNFRDINIIYNDDTRRTVTTNDMMKTNWGNIVASARWNHVFGNSLFSNYTVSFCRYRFNNSTTNHNPTDTTDITSYREYSSGINDVNARADFSWYTPFMPGILRFGANMTYHLFKPGVFINTSQTGSNNQELTNRYDQSFYRFEWHAYVEDDMEFGKFNINAGLHLSALNRDNKSPYVRIEPRLLAGYQATKRLHFNLSYSDMTQFVQLHRMTTVSTPADMWLPVSSSLAPPRAWQIAFETQVSMGKYMSLTAEIYRKRYINQQTYSSTMTVESLGNYNWETLICGGSGRAYGGEIFLHRRAGKLSGWAGYALSKAVNKFADINDGEEFPMDHDRRHSVSVFGSYKLTDNVDLSATWTYNTGSPVTISDKRMAIVGSEDADRLYAVPGRRNAYRLPESHALNIGINIRKRKRKTDRLLSFGVYNVYGRKNPMFVYWSEDQDTPAAERSTYELRQFSLIAWPCPYIKYSVRF